MRSLSHVACVLLLAAAPLLAAPPVDVPAEVKGDVGDYVTVRAKTAGKVVYFTPIDAGLKVFPADLLADKKATVVSATKPGRYRVLAYSAVGGEPTEPAIVTVVIGGVEPAPEPKPIPPDPKPKPDPAPKAESVWVIVVEPPDGRTVAAAKALNDPYWQSLKPRHDYRHYLSTSETAVGNGYVAKAKAAGVSLPAVLVLDAKDGDPLKVFPLDGIEGVKAAVNEVTK